MWTFILVLWSGEINVKQCFHCYLIRILFRSVAYVPFWWHATTTCNQCISPLTLWVRFPLRQGVLDTILSNAICQWLATGWRSSPGPPVSSINKTDNHDITEILLKVDGVVSLCFIFGRTVRFFNEWNYTVNYILYLLVHVLYIVMWLLSTVDRVCGQECS